MIILGSTGSIGKTALSMAQCFNKHIDSLVAGHNIDLLNKQIDMFKPRSVGIAEEKDVKKLKAKGARIYVGEDGITQLIQDSSASVVLNALVGFIGLKPSLVTQQCGKTLALANKESLVSGGWLLDTDRIIPIDSEHFGLWYLKNERVIKRLIITASGGAFRDFPVESIHSQQKQTALLHPNWNMGQKITIDSANMVNKLFEVLEAFWLFGTRNIDALIERSSSIHALVEFIDGSTTAHFALPDMKLPIGYAIDSALAAKTKILDSISLKDIANMRFEAIDTIRYPIWEIRENLLENPKLGVVLNAANEVLVGAFLRDEIYFGDISKTIFNILEHNKAMPSLQIYEEIASFDIYIRTQTLKLISKKA